ncbi:MAG: hypothetical protein KDD61_04720, partial [Bdellovibrionales bacterium]|nr:hypothetical protein [Bdellovibrionales bacterium]
MNFKLHPLIADEGSDPLNSPNANARRSHIFSVGRSDKQDAVPPQAGWQQGRSRAPKLNVCDLRAFALGLLRGSEPSSAIKGCNLKFIRNTRIRFLIFKVGRWF